MKVSETFHLSRRSNGVWYYRRRVPDHVIAALGARTIQYSLGTTNKRKAKKLREVEDLKWSARFSAHTTGSSGVNDKASHRPLSGTTAVRLVRDYVERMDRSFQERYRRYPPDSAGLKREMQIEAETDLDILRDTDDPRGDEDVSHTFDSVLDRTGTTLDPSSVTDGEFADLIRRGLLELRRRRAARLRDSFDRSHFDALFDPATPPPVTFGELAEQYVALQLEDAAINGTGRKWTDKVRANTALLCEIIGNETPVAGIDYDTCLNVRSMLTRTPSNRTKLYPKLTLQAAITKAEIDRKPALSATTQRQYIDTLRGILELATLKRLIPGNPAQSLRPLKRDDTAAGDKRLSFTPDQLTSFFASDFYRSCAPDAEKPYTKPDRDWRFWLPLLCLFMGMRPNEACQMLVADVRRTKNGTWYVDLATTGDDDEGAGTISHTGKTLKTATSRRRIPIHPELIAIGFREFVDSRRASPDGPRLFARLKPDKYGNLATYALRRFRETFLPEAVSMNKRQSFYSFRHSFRDALRRIDAQPATLQALGGWSQGSLTSDSYGDKSDPDYQMPFLAKVQFPGVDLTFLQPVAASEDQSETDAG